MVSPALGLAVDWTLVGILAAVNQAFLALMSLIFRRCHELKLFLLVGIFVYAFVHEFNRDG
jgi:hypothetical protein